uniref:RNase H type-1 domain-containing protein n=1 Tax=Manihot esculenta TaxID=3983 RepID=A0A199UBY3_MANES
MMPKCFMKALQLSGSYCRPEFIGIVIKSDSSDAIKWITSSPNNRPWRLQQVFNTIDNLRMKIGNVSFHDVFRDRNHVADQLAKQEVSRNSDFVAWIEPNFV